MSLLYSVSEKTIGRIENIHVVSSPETSSAEVPWASLPFQVFVFAIKKRSTDGGGPGRLGPPPPLRRFARFNHQP